MDMARLRNKFPWWLLLSTALFHPLALVCAQRDTLSPAHSLDPADAAACGTQLNVIYEAIQEYQRQNHRLPSSLSELVPDFLSDRNVLVCPFVARTLDLKSWRAGIRADVFFDPRASYGYEFSSQVWLPLDKWRGVKKTYLEYKEQQVIRLGPELGPSVALVRCLAHRPMLNMAFNGCIYESGSNWEESVAPKVPHEELEPSRVLTDLAARTLTPVFPPPRDPRASAWLVDLSAHYNAALTNAWQGFPGNDLAALPQGLQEFNGVRFDVRGLIQLGSPDLPRSFPPTVEGIPVHQTCHRIHFLHAIALGYYGEVAAYRVHYADGQQREIPLRFGKETADWWFKLGSTNFSITVEIAWTGNNAAALSNELAIRLCHMTWDNPLPNVAIRTISFTSLGKGAAPFLVAITLEPPP